jgi:molybdopterin synthase catalytic subunit
MDVGKMVQMLKRHPKSWKMGMIATHLGIVRGSSLTGRNVYKVEVTFDTNKIRSIISDIKLLDGIIDVSVDFNAGVLQVGEEIMAVAVAGDTREHVFPALIQAVERIKTEASRKKEFFDPGEEHNGHD